MYRSLWYIRTLQRNFYLYIVNFILVFQPILPVAVQTSIQPVSGGEGGESGHREGEALPAFPPALATACDKDCVEVASRNQSITVQPGSAFSVIQDLQGTINLQVSCVSLLTIGVFSRGDFSWPEWKQWSRIDKIYWNKVFHAVFVQLLLII